MTAPRGFLAAGVGCGIRHEGELDLGLLFSDRPAVAAATYTTNVVQAAPLRVTRAAVAGGAVRALVVNSGNANAATGERGLRAAREMQRAAADKLGLEPEQVAVASTGVIGEHLPVERVRAGIADAGASLGANGEPFAEAILTTDTHTKQAARRVEVGGVSISIGAVAKGSGMVHPNMATMLAFVTTDAAVEAECLDGALRAAVGRSFNRITIDGDTSTNDLVLALANGAAENEPLTEDSPDYPVFYAALEGVLRELARQVAADGEGATRLVEVSVAGAEDEESAARLARSVVGSDLVKTAIFGEDANWGRVLCALGYAGVEFDPDSTSISFGSGEGAVLVFEDGLPTAHDAAAANATLTGDEVSIAVRVGSGAGSASAWGCDLSYEYVRINGDYRT